MSREIEIQEQNVLNGLAIAWRYSRLTEERECIETATAALESLKLAALEASRLTSVAEPDAPHAVPMSGGAEPAGAAKPSPEQTC